MLHFLWSRYQLREKSYNVYEYSNLEIAKWAEYYLSEKTSFHQSSWLSGRVTDRPDDILLGHPTWEENNGAYSEHGKLLRNWVRDNAITALEQCHPHTYIIMPWTPDFPDAWLINMPHLEWQLLQARKIFALCGSIWIDRTFELKNDSVQFMVKDKLIHSNMGIANQNFPTYKTRFNPIGERGILHISNLAPYKGFDITCQSLVGLDTLLSVGCQSLNMEKGMIKAELDKGELFFNFLGLVENSNLDQNNWIINNCDFYIHTAIMDAQATTILENCLRGLVPLITPESGFSSPHAIYLTHDPLKNREIIKWALNLPEEELLHRSTLVRDQIIREHNWELIFDKIWNEIQNDIYANEGKY